MFEILLNIMCLGSSAYFFGFAFFQLIGYQNNRYRVSKRGQAIEADLAVVMGICILTVYAQIFSLFHQVGTIAFCIVVLIDIFIIIFYREKLINSYKGCFSKKFILFGIVLVFVGFIVISLANQPPGHYDTDLYHAQSIHWIEEFGIVPGLGNLHNRLAYNSSFFSLQALFSWKFLLGRSLHAVNAFVYLFYLYYAISSTKAYVYKKIFASDFLRMAIIVYLNYDFTISSPDTDHLALTLFLYVLTKWVEMWEEDTVGGGGFEVKYGALSLIALFAVSVKLSVGMVILLAIYPLVKLVSLHDWKTIAKYFCIGMVIIIPFFIRNIIISGYMVYPYSKIDLFNVDWKMPSYTLDFDRYEIRAWGQGLKNVNRFNAGIHQWFPSWVKQLDGGLRMIFYLNVPCSIVGLIVGIWQIIKKKNVNYFIMICTMAASVLLWFHGAPLIRYGMCYLIILPLFMLGCMFSLIKKSSKIVIIAVAGVTLYHIRPLITADNSMSPVLKYNADYCILESDKLFLDGIEVYCPVGGDQAGYYNFPSTPYRRRLELIQLRGDSIQDGFRMKEEYKDELVTTYGKFARFNMFEMQFQDKDNEIRRRRKMVNYLEEINDPRYIIFMSVKEEGTNALTKEIKAGLEKLGLKTDLTGQFGRSYYAVISGDEIIEEISDIKLEAGGTVMDADISYSVVSAGYDCGCVSSIIIDGKEYSINSRGINIVIYNNETNQVVDTVCFDTSENLSEDRFAIH